ncbi:hypothetical protein MSI_16010 [Treponema sp. JC4]|uniref:hypothetical protein n=1 Tax=Treponema sp. JC4 TaxID=1124982 RepID=UPI00025BEAC7|nr:hypothetical protein [Treponema sp. JC4]EID84905.1 hypothetical protein MSI_16010 [Treponema sp. JC4]
MQIKLNKVKRVIIGLAGLAALFLYSSCEIGLGESVDTEAPKGAISSPDVDAIIRSVFAIQGTWTDDGSVSSVSITLQNTSTETKTEYSATIEDGKWYCEIDPNDEAQPIVDGSYLATVVLKDDGGHTTTLTRSYTIDNTAPLIVLQRPSTKANAASADVFGQTFTLKGQAVDDNDVSKILVKVYSDQDCTNLLKSIELSNVPANMEMDVATYEAGNTSNDYYQIYGDYDENKKETKTFYCKLEAYDGAAYYPLKESEASSDGNCATNYYLYSDISTLISSYKSTGIYKMQNGTYDGETDTIEAVKEKLAANEVTVSKFSLNPDNSPTFTVEGTGKLVSGESLLTSAGALSTGCSITNKSKELIVTISPGRDEISINADDEEKPLSVYLMECDDSGNITGSEKIPLITTYLNSTGTEWILVEGQGSVTISDSSYVITTGTISTENYAIETYNSTTKKLYRVCVSAYDDNDLKVVEYNSKIYAFGLSSSASIIETTVSSSPEYVSVNEAANADNKILKVSLTYTYDGKAYLMRTIGSKDAEKVDYDDTKTDDEKYEFPAGTDVSFTDKISVEDLKESDGTYASTIVYKFISILGEDVAASNTKTVNVKYDNEVPVAGSVSVPSTSETALSSFSFSGSVSDAASGIDKVYIRITDNTDSTKTTGDLVASGTESWIYKFSASDLPEGGAFDEEGYKTVLIWALDKVGLSTILYSSDSWIYDTSAPEFTIDSYISADSDGNYSGSSLSITTSTSGSASFNTGKAFKLIGSASDNFGIKQISVSQSDGTNTLTLDSDTDGGIVYNSTDGSWYIEDLPRDSSGSGVSLPDVGSLATYTYTFSIKDYGDSYATAKTLSVVIDREAPVITITAPDSADSSSDTVTPEYSAFGEGSLNGDAATFRGSVSDGEGLGMQYYSYVITDSSTAPAKDEVDSDGNSIWTQKSKTSSGNWSFSLPLGNGRSGTDTDTLYEGTHYLYVYAVDQANNESDIISVPFCVDQNAPSIAVLMETKKSDSESESDSENSYTALGSLSSYDISDADLFRFVVYASDTNGISSVSAVNSVDNTEFTLTKTDDSNVWTSDDISTEGSYTIVISVEDISGNGLSGESALSGRKTTVTKTVVFDKTAPTIDSVKINNTDITSATDNSTSWYASNTVTVIVTASDNASGLSAVQYSTDNTDEESWQDFLISSGTYRANVEFEDDGEHKLYLRAVDVIGNESSVFQTVDSEGTAIDGIVIKIDSSAPELESLWYKTGDVTAEASGTVYISGIETKDLTVYGTISDDDSGISGLTFTMNGNEVSPSELYYSSTESTVNESGENTKAWITTAEAASSVEEGAFAALTDFDDSTGIKTWKATFAASSIVSGKFVATGTNGAGGSYALPAFTISVDSKKPSLANISLATSNSAYSVYQPDSNTYTYYLNNENQTFTISGIATDDKGVSKVAISVENYSNEVSTSGEWTFTGIDLTSVSAASTTATVTAYDLAGNAQEQSITLNIDKTAPLAKHWADKNDKDIYFRIGNADNEKTASASSSSGYVNEAGNTWDSDLDEDVGGKYSAGTYGNSSTIEIRGYFEEASSGLKMIYYKIFSSAPTAEEIEALVTGYKSLPNYFSPLSSEKIRRVIYTDSSDTKTSISGVPSNFDSTISGFDNEKNYLVLLAVDNVGNVSADTLSGYSVNNSTTTSESDYTSKWNGTDTSGNGLEYYSINVDTVVPEISDSVYSNKSTAADNLLSETLYSNKGEAEADYITLWGLATDNAAGISSIVFTVNGNEISTSSDTYGTLTIKQSESENLGGSSQTLSETNTFWKVIIKPAAFGNLTSGNVSVYAKLTDKAGDGNSKTVSVATVTLDAIAPTVTLSTPTDADSDTDGTQINGTISLTGTISDANTLPDSAVYAVQYSTDTANWSDVTTELMSDYAVSGSYSYTVTGFDTTKLTDEKQYYIRVAAKDAAGNIGYSASLPVFVSQDTDRPVIRYTNLTLGESMSSSSYLAFDTNELYGSISDDDGVTGLTLAYQTAVSDSALTDSGWKTLTLNNGSFTLTFDEDGKKNLYFKVTDVNSNDFISSAEDEYNISSPKITDGTNKYGYKDTSTVTYTKPTVSYIKVDTIAPSVDSIEYCLDPSADNAEWSTAISSQTFGGTNSSFYIHQYAYDANDVESVTLTIASNEKDESDSVYTYEFTKQSTTKTLNENTYYEWRSGEIDISSLASGSRSFTVTVSDGVKTTPTSIYVTIDNTAPVIKVTGPSSSNTSSGSITIYGTVDCEATTYFAVSTSNEVKPDETTAITTWSGKDSDGNATSGIISDIASKVSYTQIEDASLSWFVYFDGDTTSATETTHSVTLNDYLVNFGITTNDELKSTTNAFETIVNLYVWIKSVDSVGNYSETAHLVQLDPQGDRPTVSISYPSVDGQTLGGKVRIAGSAEDTGGTNIGVNQVWVQIISSSHEYEAYTGETTFGTFTQTDNIITAFTPSKNDLDYLLASGYTLYNMKSYATESTHTAYSGTIADGASASNYAIPATLSGSSWSLTINSKNEFNPETSGTNSLAIRVYAMDNDGKFSINTDKYIIFDSSNPVISNLYLIQTSDNSLSVTSDTPNYSATASRQYEEDMFVKGEWWLTGCVEDNDAIKTLKIGTDSLIKNGEIKTNSNWAVVTSGTSTSKTFPDEDDGSKNVTAAVYPKVYFKYKLDTSTSVGSISLIYDVIDAAEGTAGETSSTIKVNFDNVAPVLAGAENSSYAINPNVQQSNGYYSFGSLATEAAVGTYSQSGFDCVAFFFMRRNIKGTSEVDSIFNPMIKGGKATTLSSSLIYDSGLYWQKQTVTRDSSNLNVITANVDSDIRVNGLVKIGGAFYKISAISGSTITLDGYPSIDYTEAYFAYALTINNTIQETGGSTVKTDTDGYGYPSSITNDDGDGMVEYVEKSSSNYTWSASIVSSNIPDGPVELHYVVFDKAGNYSIGIMGNMLESLFASTSTENYALTDDRSDYSTLKASDSSNVLYVDKSYSTYNGIQTSASNYKDSSVAAAAFVSNNAPRMAGFILQTDYDGDNEMDETYNDYNAAAISTASVTGTSGSKNVYNPFEKPTGKSTTNPLLTSLEAGSTSAPIKKIRGYTTITPEIVGGNGEIYYAYNVTGTNTLSGQNSTAIVTEGSTDYTINDVTPINIQLGDLLKIGDSDTGVPFKFTFWDSTDGTEKFDDSQTATLTVYLAINAAENSKPTVEITPFYWNSSSSNSLYGNSTSNGHIELEGDLPDTFTTSATGVNDRDPKVSGQIVIEGTSHDDKRIDYLYVSIPGMTMGSTTKTISGTVFYQLASYSSENKKLEGTDDWDDSGYKLEITSDAQSDSGHDVSWKLYWDSSKISTVAATDVAIQVVAYNQGIPTCAESGSSNLSIDGTTYYADPAYTSAQNNTPGTTQTSSSKATAYYKVDVVPYVAGVKTSLSSLKKKNSSVYDRTALGHYPTGSEDKVYLYGFNLAGGALSDSANTSVNLSEVTPSTTYSWYSSSYFTYPNAYEASVSDFTSGEVSVTVNGVISLNNKNDNASSGAYTTTTAASTGDYTIYSNYYNRQPNNDNNNNLTDDLILDVWSFDSDAVVPISGKIEQPHMAIDPITGQIGFAFVNGPLYFSMAGSTEDNTKTSYDYWMGSYDFFTSVGFAYDSLGYTYGVAAGGDINSSSADKFQFMTSRWGRASRAQNGSYSSSSSLRLESIGMKGTKSNTSDSTYYFDKQRIKSPSLTTSVHNNYTNVYLAYYDAMNDEIRFKAGSTNSTSTTGFGSFTDYDTEGAPYIYRNEKVSMLAGNGTSYGAGSYISLGVVSGSTATTDVVCAIWYDETSRVLWYSYNTSPLTDRNGTTDRSGWSDPVQVFSGDMENAGEYCQLAVDAKGGIHIAAYDGTNCDLVYAYLSSYSANPVTCVVDSSGVIGSNLTIDVALDSSNNAIPRIGYYATSCIRPKLAYLVNTSSTASAGADDEVYTGAWECSVVPTESSVNMQSNQYNKINVGVWKNSSTGVVKESTSGTSSYTNNPNSYNSTSYGFVYGNGTSNAVLGYAIKVSSSSDAIETAQMR